MKHEPESDGITKHSFLHSGRIVHISTEKTSRIDEKLSLGHFYEHKLLGYITRVSRSGVFLDVGGNCGQHAVYFALFCPSSVVYCVEPLPDHIKLISKNVRDNELLNKVKILPVAASDMVSSVRITTNAVNFDRHYSAVGIPLDDCVSGPVALIKIDVEGFEISALRGLKETIQRDRPFLFVECLSTCALNETSEFLASLNYRQCGEPFHSTMYEFRPTDSPVIPTE